MTKMTNDNDHTGILKGDPHECARCGKSRSEHVGAILPECPTGRWNSFRAKFDGDGSLITEHNGNPVCPWCGRVFVIDDEYELYEEGDHETECTDCERPLSVETVVTYSFTTARLPVDGSR